MRDKNMELLEFTDTMQEIKKVIWNANSAIQAIDSIRDMAVGNNMFLILDGIKPMEPNFRILEDFIEVMFDEESQRAIDKEGELSDPRIMLIQNQDGEEIELSGDDLDMLYAIITDDEEYTLKGYISKGERSKQS